MQINGVELYLDYGSISFTEKIEAAIREIQNRMEDVTRFETESEGQKKFVQEIHRFIDNVWGDGMYEKLGLDPDRFADHADIFADIMDESYRQRTEIQNQIQKRTAKYSPNRAQRRAKK